jgi:hypothetical protein
LELVEVENLSAATVFAPKYRDIEPGEAATPRLVKDNEIGERLHTLGQRVRGREITGENGCGAGLVDRGKKFASGEGGRQGGG